MGTGHGLFCGAFVCSKSVKERVVICSFLHNFYAAARPVSAPINL